MCKHQQYCIGMAGFVIIMWGGMYALKCVASNQQLTMQFSCCGGGEVAWVYYPCNSINFCNNSSLIPEDNLFLQCYFFPQTLILLRFFFDYLETASNWSWIEREAPSLVESQSFWQAHTGAHTDQCSLWCPHCSHCPVPILQCDAVYWCPHF